MDVSGGTLFCLPNASSWGKGLLAVNRFSKGNLRTTGFNTKRFLEALTQFESTNGMTCYVLQGKRCKLGHLGFNCIRAE